VISTAQNGSSSLRLRSSPKKLKVSRDGGKNEDWQGEDDKNFFSKYGFERKC
jgi:hypothetical protein